MWRFLLEFVSFHVFRAGIQPTCALFFNTENNEAPKHRACHEKSVHLPNAVGLFTCRIGLLPLHPQPWCTQPCCLSSVTWWCVFWKDLRVWGLRTWGCKGEGKSWVGHDRRYAPYMNDIWWSPCPKYCLNTVYAYKYMVLAHPTCITFCAKLVHERFWGIARSGHTRVCSKPHTAVYTCSRHPFRWQIRKRGLIDFYYLLSYPSQLKCPWLKLTTLIKSSGIQYRLLLTDIVHLHLSLTTGIGWRVWMWPTGTGTGR